MCHDPFCGVSCFANLPIKVKPCLLYTSAPTPAPTPHKVQTIPQTGDGFPLLAIVVVSLVSATGIVLLTVKQMCIRDRYS